MFKKSFVALCAVAIVSVGLSLNAEKKKAAPKITCPISGKAVNDKAIVSHNGGDVKFCCNNCVAAFKKDPSKFAAKANLQLVQSGQAKQVNCPFAGKKVNASTAISIEGVDVAFCCGNCKKKAAASSDAITLVFNEKSFKKGFEVAKKKK
jgi:YHS domain-containing protein